MFERRRFFKASSFDSFMHLPFLEVDALLFGREE
jgi:hypothetical protein